MTPWPASGCGSGEDDGTSRPAPERRGSWGTHRGDGSTASQRLLLLLAELLLLLLPAELLLLLLSAKLLLRLLPVKLLLLLLLSVELLLRETKLLLLPAKLLLRLVELLLRLVELLLRLVELLLRLVERLLLLLALLLPLCLQELSQLLLLTAAGAAVGRQLLLDTGEVLQQRAVVAARVTLRGDLRPTVTTRGQQQHQ